MHSSCSLWATALSPLLLLLTAAGPTSALTEDEKETMVELHNFYRAQVSPPASDMLQMRWDDHLAAFAKAYAQKCVWGHNKERGRRGENLFAITDEGMDVPLAVGNWFEEREHYNLSTATCDPGQMCGHYTQVVWSKTERIGCGSHFCESLHGVEEANIHLLVCNYEPPGNVKGRKPYQEGTPCSQCPVGYNCKNSLCEPTRNPKEEQDSPPRVTEVPSITRATEAPSSRETGTPSLATSETLRFSSVTKVSDSLATESSPAAETKAPSSLATEGPSSMATEAQSFPTEVPYVSTTHTQPSRDEGPVNFLTSAHIPVPKSTDKEGSKSSATSVSPEKSLYPKMSLTQTGESLPLAQEEAEADAELPEAEAEAELPEAEAELPEAEAELPEAEVQLPEAEVQLPEAEAELPEAESRLPEVEARFPGAEGELPEAEAELPVSSEVVVPVLPAQEHGGPQASLDHSGPPASTSLPNFPSVSAEANATGGRTLALQSLLTDAGLDLENSGHVQGPFLGLLLPPLLLSGIF
ncbi:peptidase inhibitor 16 [Microtus ochrogaster]|uniref:Peptidase inhibitor 16 n=1 Tax=Microtus ochrogaster TaxID=79684 RepID=A0ABM1AQV1_MICOH|nr:peptidase inhibitor 16 [Microtus ochrogaster]XP_026641211.1 peptidase inhibitor 16 [Microtus ochrogaster]XP_026641212.1 peptidase inhibitor 16 [Microtus ochrogaster]